MTIKLQGKEIRQAFEVEQMTNGVRHNYTFEWNAAAQKIVVWNTSRGFNKYFDEDATDAAWERFKQIYKESITTYSFEKGIFLGWVDPVTKEPLED